MKPVDVSALYASRPSPRGFSSRSSPSFSPKAGDPIRAFWDVEKLSCDLHELAQHFGDESHHNYRLDPDPDPDGELREFLIDLFEDADPGDIIPLEDEERVAA